MVTIGERDLDSEAMPNTDTLGWLRQYSSQSLNIWKEEWGHMYVLPTDIMVHNPIGAVCLNPALRWYWDHVWVGSADASSPHKKKERGMLMAMHCLICIRKLERIVQTGTLCMSSLSRFYSTFALEGKRRFCLLSTKQLFGGQDLQLRELSTTRASGSFSSFRTTRSCSSLYLGIQFSFWRKLVHKYPWLPWPKVPCNKS